MSKVVKLGQVKSPSPSSKYIAFCPAAQDSSDTILRNRAGADGTLGALTTGQAWAVAGRISSVAGGSSKVATLPSGQSWNPATDSMLFVFRAKCTLPGAKTGIAGHGADTTNVGWTIRCDTAGQLEFWLYGAAGQAASSAVAGAFSATVEKTFAVAWDAPTSTAYIYVLQDTDAAPSVASVKNMSLAAVGAIGAMPQPCRVGGSAAATTVTGAYNNIHYLLFPASGLPSIPATAVGNPTLLDNVIWRLHKNPLSPIMASEIA